MRYRTIVADPPWDYPEGFASQSWVRGKWKGPVVQRALPYASLNIWQICALPIARFADADSRLFLWTTNRYLPDAFMVLGAWGFVYRQTLTWCKPNSLNGSVAPNSEFLLVGTRGKPELIGRMPRSVFEIGHGGGASSLTHSRKPEVFIDWIEQVSPGPYVELFSRRHRLGWDVWGDESANTAELAV